MSFACSRQKLCMAVVDMPMSIHCRVHPRQQQNEPCCTTQLALDVLQGQPAHYLPSWAPMPIKAGVAKICLAVQIYSDSFPLAFKGTRPVAAVANATCLAYQLLGAHLAWLARSSHASRQRHSIMTYLVSHAAPV